MSRLAELKARIKQKEKETKEKGGSNYYKHYEAPFDSEIVLRLLEDADKENPEMIMIPKYQHKLTFNGETKRVLCLATYGEECPICDRSQKYYKAKDKDMGKYYWKSTSFILRGTIVKDPLPVNEAGQNAVGKTVILDIIPEIKNRIIAGISEFADDDADPWDLDNGCNFVIRKKKSGEYSDYNQSGFERRPSSLPAEYRADIQEVDLKTLLPKNPGLDYVCALLDAHDANKSWDDFNSNNGNSKATTASKQSSKVSENVKPKSENTSAAVEDNEKAAVPAKVVTPVEDKSSDDGEDDILARIKNRTKKATT